MTTVAKTQTLQAHPKDALVQVIQHDLVNDLKALRIYELAVKETDDEYMLMRLNVSYNEALSHFSELVSLLSYLDPDTGRLFSEN